MSELKALTVMTAYQLECNDDDLVYLKFEADKVIAGLKQKLEAKEIEFANLKEDALNTDKAREKWFQLARKQAMENKGLRRALYKACANWARAERRPLETWGCYEEAQKWLDAEHKCLAMAEKFGG